MFLYFNSFQRNIPRANKWYRNLSSYKEINKFYPDEITLRDCYERPTPIVFISGKIK